MLDFPLHGACSWFINLSNNISVEECIKNSQQLNPYITSFLAYILVLMHFYLNVNVN